MDHGTNNPAMQAKRRYLIEFAASMIAYVAAMAISRNLLEGSLRNAGMTWQSAIALSPLIALVFVFISIVRYLLATDEMIRRICVNSLAIAGGATMLLAVGYGLIEGGNLPKLSVWWTYITFMSVWLVASFFVRRRYQ